MKVVLLVVLLCLVGVDSNIYTFFSMLTDGLANVWSAMKEFVKRPPRFKQIRQENAESPSPPILLNRDGDIIDRLGWADMVTTATTTGFPTKKYTMAPDMMYYFQRPRHKQVLLPIIKIPQWKTRDDWLDIQKPYQGFFYRKGRFNPGAKDRERGMKTFPITKDNDFYDIGDVSNRSVTSLIKTLQWCDKDGITQNCKRKKKTAVERHQRVATLRNFYFIN